MSGWTFDDAALADRFSSELEAHVPGYREMRRVLHEISMSFLPYGGDVLDLGASTGIPIVALYDALVRAGHLHQSTFHLIENAPAMLDALRVRFGKCPSVTIDDTDLTSCRDGTSLFSSKRYFFDLVLSILTMQFIPVERRIFLLKKIYDRTRKAFVFVEKVVGSSFEFEQLLAAQLRKHKEIEGLSPDQIHRKQKLLENVLVPLSASENERMLRVAGFSQVECVWRNLNFVAWLALP